ncbi:MAG: DUF6364 family protein [Burkholderiaceae bacterium]|jgi:hypothetical protein|nr:DUF6364 family protein [Burkholderiaceae bacterium]
MNAKLTLRLDEGRIERAKRYAALTGKSVSRLVEDYFALLPDNDLAKTPEGVVEVELTPRVRSMLGVLKGAFPSAQAAIDDYRRHREEKYLGSASR